MTEAVNLRGEIFPVEGCESEQIREVYARYGLAMYYSQVIEHGMVNIIVAHEIQKKQKSLKDIDRKQFDDFFDKTFKFTFGNMLKIIEGSSLLPLDLFQELSVIKKDRDFLAHRFFEHYSAAFASDLGRKEMICFCDDFREKCISIDSKLDKQSDEKWIQIGMTLDMKEKLLSEILRNFECE